MKDTENIHQKVQEHIDCFATTDPLKEMAELQQEGDVEDAGVKWLAFATLHGINQNAKKITVAKNTDGQISVTAEYRPAHLPSPGNKAGEQIFSVIRDITHLEGKSGEIPLAMGVRDSSVQMNVKLETDNGLEKLVLKFPE